MVEFTQNLLKFKKANAAKLESFGFKKDNEGYVFQTPILNGQMLLTIKYENGALQTEVFDLENDMPYTLYKIKGATGSFVGQVRQDCQDLLTKIANECFEREVFSSAQSKQIINYIDEKYGDQLEYLWEKFSNNAIWRRQDNKKWYAALIKIPKNKLGIDSNDEVEIIDLRADSATIKNLIDGKSFFQAYHMNKQHWITVTLDGSIQTELITKLIDQSFALAAK